MDVRTEGILEMGGSITNPRVWNVEDKKWGVMNLKRENRRDNTGRSVGKLTRVRRDTYKRGRSR